MSVRDHLVDINLRRDRSGGSFQIFCRGPFVSKIVDVELDHIVLRIFVINGSSHAMVGGPQRGNALVLQAGIGAKQIVQCGVFESDVL